MNTWEKKNELKVAELMGKVDLSQLMNIIAVTMYEAEGDKSGAAAIANMDYAVHILFKTFIQHNFPEYTFYYSVGINEGRIAEVETFVSRWADKLNIPSSAIKVVIQKQRSSFKSNPNYAGVFRTRIQGNSVYLRRALKELYNKLLYKAINVRGSSKERKRKKFPG